MFESGFDFLKKEGMTHMSVEKITSSCGIGKSTFYNFFSSKVEISPLSILPIAFTSILNWKSF